MARSKRFVYWVFSAVLMLSLFGLAGRSGASAPAQEPNETIVYIVRNVFDVQTRSAIAATGALILEVGHDYVLVEATLQEYQAIARMGLAISQPTVRSWHTGFSPADSAYHDFAEMVAGNSAGGERTPGDFFVIQYRRLLRRPGHLGRQDLE
jgi:hypothetical protein